MNLSRRQFLGSSLATLGATMLGTPRFAMAQSSASVLRDPLLDFTPDEQRRLDRLMRAGVLDIAPVLSVAAEDVTSHLGWPVATMLPGGRVVVVYTRKSGHHGPEDEPHAGRHVIVSDDLTRWTPANPSRVGVHEGMHCVGHAATPGGERVVLVTSDRPRRVYLSDDGGVTWRSRDDAFDATLDDAAHVGPNLVAHPDFGLVAAFGQQPKTKRGGRNFLVRSRDAGQTWDVHAWPNTAAARSVEPALAAWGDGHMVMLTREWDAAFAVGADGYFGHTQHVYRHRPGARFEDVACTTQRTNIAGNPAAGLGCHDTADVVYNPVSRRIEMLQSHRWGGGPGRTGATLADGKDREISSLNLWSIDPDALLDGSADWRFDGTLVERIGYSRKGNKDGLHPGGSILDTARGVQHVFVYAGWRRRPCNLYRITRTLDTERWRRAQQAAAAGS